MTHLLSDARAVEAATEEVYRLRGLRRQPLASDEAVAVLSAAVAALPRDELIEKALSDETDWIYVAANGCAMARPRAEVAERILVRVGLIPEHVTATEEPK